MAKKYKVTGCAKFFFVLIILTPLAFIGASYYNGQDPFKTLGGIFGSDGSSDPIERSASNDLEEENKKLEKDVKYFKREMERLEKELADCQEVQTGG